MRYLYSVVRFVPNPASGEFVNIGAIAGSETRGDWSTRHVSRDRRALTIGRAESLSALYSFLAGVEERISLHDWALEVDDQLAEPELSEAWLYDLFYRYRNIVQLSQPAPMVADSAEDALDQVFEQMIHEPTIEHRPYMTRHGVFSPLRAEYRRAGVGTLLTKQRVRLRVGDLYAPVDFAIGHNEILQIAQTWSFQIAGVQDVAKEIKAWGYTLRALRETSGTIVGEPNATVPSNVDIEVLYTLPRTNDQEIVFGEAKRVFEDIQAKLVLDQDASEVASSAAGRLAKAGLLGRLDEGDL